MESAFGWTDDLHQALASGKPTFLVVPAHHPDAMI
jgi:hypothetical protein